MKTEKAQELLEVAFMLICFADLGAPVERHVLGWARQLVWMNP